MAQGGLMRKAENKVLWYVLGKAYVMSSNFIEFVHDDDSITAISKPRDNSDTLFFGKAFIEHSTVKNLSMVLY